ncbi:hypothetical protein FMN50_02250 [Rhodobacterales bacterium]|nr:hypothetical protein FMN50_02250 [Rhodobacterales bacterium]
MTRYACLCLVGIGLLFSLVSCGVGPGTPLVDALRTPPGKGTGNVPAPTGYATQVGTIESSGLIDPKERKATQEYLKSLAME